MKKLLLTVFMAMFAISASAVKLSFYFKVHSSGPSIYACNVGFKHDAKAEICYKKNKDKFQSCNPKECPEGKACSCVCTGNADGKATTGEEMRDFYKVVYSDWLENGEFVTKKDQTTKVVNGSTVLKTLFSDKDQFEKTLHKLDFNLGSETYGAEYFVDICYRGPDIDYFMATQDAGDVLQGVFTYNAQTTVNDLTSESPYSQLSGLETKVELICDNQGKGKEKYAYTSSNSDFIGISSDDKKAWMIGNSNTWKKLQHGNTGVSGNASNDAVKNAPRFCKFRYYFREGIGFGSKKSSVDAIRDWERQSANVCTYTLVDEPLQ